MAQIFECWFPDEGQELRDSGAYLADTPEEAAEKAARERCWKSTEWHDRLVAVSQQIGDAPTLFDVEVSNEPVFKAMKLEAES